MVFTDAARFISLTLLIIIQVKSNFILFYFTFLLISLCFKWLIPLPYPCASAISPLISSQLPVLEVVTASIQKCTVGKWVLFLPDSVQVNWIGVSLVASDKHKDNNKGAVCDTGAKTAFCLSKWKGRERSISFGFTFSHSKTGVEDSAPPMEMWRLATMLASEHKLY